MGFTIAQECPQCGAPIELDETDHLIRCPFCNVQNYLFTQDHFHFVLPHTAPHRDIIYAPYMRFKGEVYLCKGASISHRIIDITHRGTTYEQLPISLGLRPQAMKMHFVTPDVSGAFLKCTLDPSEVLTTVGKRTSVFPPGKLFHRAYIGEAFSLIYLPLFVHNNRLCDAVRNISFTTLPHGANSFSSAGDTNPRWHITFIATLCPRCGWNLEGERDSVVLTCSNCNTAWEVSKNTFVQVSCRTVPTDHGEEVRYLPFWKITARDERMGINTYADFIRITKHPTVIQKGWDSKELSFWIPAFKIRPKVFLRLARQMTILQTDFAVEERIPKKNPYPVTLPRSEAVQGLKLTVASAVMTKRKFFPLLPHVNFSVYQCHLTYLPWRTTGHELIQEQLNMGINKNTLKYGRYL
jgi:predicted nucleic-acid-binding Zn-ribbon protein